MATSFAEKQQWVASLEAVTSSNKNSNKITDASVFGNVIFRMPSQSDSRMDVMCTWPLSDEVSNFLRTSLFILCFLCFCFLGPVCLLCFFVLLLYSLLLTLNCQGFCVFFYLGSVCLFCVFGVFSLACFELSVPVQVIAWKDLTLK